MSGPAVVIGFILLIPSVAGMILAALIFVGVIAYGGKGVENTNEANQSFQNHVDAGFRRSCAKNFRQSYEGTAGPSPSSQLTEEYCECALAKWKETGSPAEAAQTCIQQAKDGTLDAVSQNVDALYVGPSPPATRSNSSAALLHVFGTLSALAIGITSFVGGLLGWLLVMKKRVLQCNACGAVVNAS